MQQGDEERAQLAQALKDAQDGIAQDIAKAQLAADAMLQKAQIDAAARLAVARLDAETRKEIALLDAGNALNVQDAKATAAQEQAILEAELSASAALPPVEIVDEFVPGDLEPRGFVSE